MSAYKCNKPTREKKELYNRNEDTKNKEMLRFSRIKVRKIQSKEEKYKSGLKAMQQKNTAKSERGRGRGTDLHQSVSNMNRSGFKSRPTDYNHKVGALFNNIL